MNLIRRAVCVTLLFSACVTSSLWAAEGFDHIITPQIEGFERTTQPNLYVLEVQAKPLRIIWTEITDPKTGEKKTEQIWYLAYRVINRPFRKPAEDDSKPVNQLDPEPGPPYFVPSFTLVTNDDDQSTTHQDIVLPEAQIAINERERREFKNSVEIVGPIPPSTSGDATDDQMLFGVATFRGVDPKTDRFTIYMSGFSNGYRKAEGPNGPIVERKTIMQKFWRPGDQFDVNFREFRFDGDPQWIYRPEVLTKE